MAGVSYNDVWEDLKNENEEARIAYETAEDLSKIIIELIEARVDRGYSQRNLAERCGLKQSAIARMESLKTIPRLDTVIKVANALNVVISVNRVVMHFSGSDKYNPSLGVNDYYKSSYENLSNHNYKIGEQKWSPSLIIS